MRPTNSILRHLSKMKTYVHIRTCIYMFKTVLFTRAKRWKPPRCPSADEQINSMRQLQRVGCCPVTQREWGTNMFTTYMNFRNTELSERSWVGKTPLTWFYLYEIFRKRNLWGRLVITWGWGWKQAVNVDRQERSFQGDRNAPNWMRWWLHDCKFSKNHWIIYL